MHKLIDYVCSELDGLERKAEKSGLTMSEVQYMDTLAHAKKNLLTGEAMMDRGESGYYMPMYGRSYGDHSTDGDSYARRRDSMGRYSRGMSYGDNSVEELRVLMEKAPNESIKREYRKLIDKIEEM